MFLITVVHFLSFYLPHSIWHGTDYKTGLRLSVYQSVRTLAVTFLDRFLPKLALM